MGTISKIVEDINFEEIRKEKKEILETYKLPDRLELFTFDEAEKYFETVTPKRFGPQEILLLILGIASDKPIKGKTVMMKQAFLAEKELEWEMQDLQFVSHKYGPHSFLVENILKNMEFMGLIVKKGDSVNTKYYLGEKGKKRVKETLKKLSSQEQKKLLRNRISWDELGKDGIIEFVYKHYEEYTHKSLLKKRYYFVDWAKKETI